MASKRTPVSKAPVQKQISSSDAKPAGDSFKSILFEILRTLRLILEAIVGIFNQRDDKKKTVRRTVTVRTSLKSLDPTSEDRDTEVELFETSTIIFSRSYEYVIKDANGYPAGKTSIFVSWPCYREELLAVKDAVTKFCVSELRKSVDKASGKQSTTEPHAPPSTPTTTPTTPTTGS
jgi:hypothetical protein